MKYWKMAASALLTGVVLSSAPAEAQVRRPPQQAQPQIQRAVPRQTMPRYANPNDWRRFESGIRRNDRNFSIGFAYYSGSPFGINNMIPYYGGMPGYFNGDLWYPLCFGPRPLTRWEIVNQQYMNISRFGPTIGDLRTMRYNMAVGGPYVYSPQGQPAEPVNDDLARENEDLVRENDELRQQLGQNRLNEAEQRGYERGRVETQKAEPLCEEERPAPPPSQTDRIKLPIEYGGGVAKVQYAGVAKDFYNFGLFEGLRKVSDGNTNLVAYIEGANRLVIRDGNDGMSNLLRIDMSVYSNCTNVDDLFDKATSEILNGINIDPTKVYSARASIDIAKSDYSACVAKSGA